MVRCRYCGEEFVLLPGKPGYKDECPQCLHEKTMPHAGRIEKDWDVKAEQIRKLLLKHGTGLIHGTEWTDDIIQKCRELYWSPPATHK